VKIGLAIAIVVALAVAYLIASSTFRGPRYRVEVCMYFDNRFNCKTVSARSEQAALRSAVENACADLASGVTDTLNCQNTQPRTVKWLQRPAAK
jgi:hypothetical protein